MAVLDIQISMFLIGIVILNLPWPTFALAPEGIVLLPMKSGETVGLIFVAGLNMTYQQYEVLGKQIQEEFPFELWIYISDNDLSWPDREPPQNINETLIGYGKSQLVKAGFPELAPAFAAGHNYAAELIVFFELQQYPEIADGAVMLGTHVDEIDYLTYPRPVIVINGDLDGNRRITQTSDQFRYVHEEVEIGNKDFSYNFPHVLVEGMNHAQFTTGDLPSWIQQLWIEPEITDDISRSLIGEALTTFMLFHSTENGVIKEEAKQRLEEYYYQMNVTVDPIYKAFDLEYIPDEELCPWCLQGYEIITDLESEYLQNVQLMNLVYCNRSEFLSNQPVIVQIDDDNILAESHSHLPRPLLTFYEAAEMLEVKYKSKQGIMEELTGEDYQFTPTKYCRDVNVAAWNLVWDELVPDQQKDRFLEKTIDVIFLDDDDQLSGPLWIDSELLFDYDGEELIIQSTTLITRTSEVTAPYGGMHYCKLLSPAKVLEFIYVDALYDNYYDT